MSFSRRTLLQASAAALALQALPASAASPADAAAERLLARTAERLLADYPESASSAGIDTGARARLKARLTDRSGAGQVAIARQAADTLARLRRLDAAALSPEMALHVDVVRSVHELAAEGFAFPYGDVAILNPNWSYRNTPYVVAQNVGAFVEMPSFLDSSHPVRVAADADAYLARLEAYGDQLDGETERLRADGARGITLPDFLLDKCLDQIREGRAAPVAQWGVVNTLATRSADMPGAYGERAARLAAERIAPALDRQIAALEAQRARASGDAGVWKLPQGEAYYAWALRAGTTTNMSPDEVHEMDKFLFHSFIILE